MTNYFAQEIMGLDYWSQMYYLNLSLSLVISLVTILIVSFGISRSLINSTLGIILLSSSKAFIDYSTSGLENPFSHLLIVLFLWVYFNKSTNRNRKIILLSTLAGLGALNRLDTILIFIPLLTHVLLKERLTARNVFYVLVGFLPLIIWELFSLWYFGSFFPNTAYAKLNLNISRVDLITQSWRYFSDSLQSDPITLFVIGLGVIFPIIWRRKTSYFISISIVLYLIYILMIGGDFMSGRFFSPLFLISVVLIIQSLNLESGSVLFGSILLLLIYSLIVPGSPIRSARNFGEGHPEEHINEYGIADERAVYYPDLGLLSNNRSEGFPGSRYSGKDWIYNGKIEKVVLLGPLGIDGYALGPNVHVIDKNGLADPLISRLPLIDPENWRIGHFRHVIPDGYLQTISDEQNNIVDPNIAEYYDVLSEVVRGDLFSKDRMILVIRLSMGDYDHLLVNQGQ
jgi:arabinofuranosyltransferase